MISGTWFTQEINGAWEPEIEIKPVGNLTHRVGNFYYEFMGEINAPELIGMPVSQPQKFSIEMPMDRRQARRVSRKTGKRFRMVGKRSPRFR